MEKTERATKKQQELLAFVAAFIQEHDYGPSYREIMRALDYKSVSTVSVHVEGLIAKGYLSRKDNSARSLEVVQGSQNTDKTMSGRSAKDEIVAKLKSDISEADKAVLQKALTILGYETDS